MNLAPAQDSTIVRSGAPLAFEQRLIYQVEWTPPWYLFFLPVMEAGEAELSITGETLFQEKRAIRIIFKARSSGALVKLAGMKIDDDFEFVSDPETFCTFRVAKRIREGKRHRDIDVVYFPEKRRLHIREMDLAVSPHRVVRDRFVEDIPECVKDLFSALYSVRRKEFGERTSHRSIVGDNDHVKEVEVRVEKRESIDTPSGRYETWKLNTVAVLGGLFKEGGQFKIWLTADEKKIPVQFEARVNLGKVSGRLKTLQP